MMSPEQNELITRVGPGTKCGALMRHYWHPVALADDDPAVQANAGFHYEIAPMPALVVGQSQTIV